MTPNQSDRLECSELSNQFSALLTVLVPPVIDLIVQNSNASETQAISRFYRSKLYEELSRESSCLWHYGAMTLYTMFQDELLTGSYSYPEEA